MATNLYDYYTSQGKTLPTVQQRQGVATQAGISGYTGTPDQNNQLLQYLSNGATSPKTSAITSPAGQQYLQSQTQVPTTSQAPQNAPQAPSAKDAYIQAYKAYMDAQKDNENVTNAKTAYNDYMANITKSVAGKEGRGLGIPLQIVRGEQERLLKQTQPEAQRLQGEIGIAQSGYDNKLNGLKSGVDLQSKLMDFEQEDAKMKAQAEKDKLSANPAFELSQGQSRYQYDPVTKNYKLVASIAPKPTATTKQTIAEKTSSALGNYTAAFVPGAKLPDGSAIIDQNGFVTPIAWKAAIADAPSEGLSRTDFIKTFGHLLYGANGVVDPKYGLTASEIKLING